MASSDLGSDEEWIPGAEVEVDNSFAIEENLQNADQLKLSTLFARKDRETGGDSRGVAAGEHQLHNIHEGSVVFGGSKSALESSFSSADAIFKPRNQENGGTPVNGEREVMAGTSSGGSHNPSPQMQQRADPHVVFPGPPSSAVSTDLESPATPPPVTGSGSTFNGEERSGSRGSLTDLASGGRRNKILVEFPRPRTADDMSASASRGGASSRLSQTQASGELYEQIPTPATPATPNTPEQAAQAAAAAADGVHRTMKPEPLQPPVGGDRARSDSVRGMDGLGALPGFVNRGNFGQRGLMDPSGAIKYRSGSVRSETSVESEGGRSSGNVSFSVNPVGRRSESAGSAEFMDDRLVDDVEESAADLERLSSAGSQPPTMEVTNLLQMVSRMEEADSGRGVEMSQCSVVPYRSVLDCIVEILKGTRVQKQKSLKRYGQRWIWLGEDLASIVWKSKKQEFGRVALTDMSRLRTEQKELYIENVAGRKVVLVFASLEEARVWLTGLSCLVPKRCRVKMDGELLKDRLLYDPLRDTWRGRVIADQRQVEEYILIGELGEGYLALSTLDKRFFFVRVSTSLQALKEQQRIATLRKLMHRNIVRLRDVLVDEDKCVSIFSEDYMSRGVVCECLPGATMRPLSEETLLEIMPDVIRGLEYLHSRGVAHGSIRPNSLYRSGDGSVKIGDLYNTEISHPSYRAFQAPELDLPELKNSALAADVWALGATMFYMLTGFPPYGGATTEENERLRMQSKLKFPKDTRVTRKLRDLLEKMLQKDYWKRPTAADVMRHNWFQPRVVQRPGSRFEVNAEDVENAIRKFSW